MTSPVIHGYPDFGRFIARATKLYVNDVTTALNGVVTRGPFFVGDVAHLAYVFDCSGTTVEFRAEYYLDEAMTVFLGDQTIDSGVDGGFDFSLPTQGPWVLFRITPVSATGSYDLLAYEVGGSLANLRGNSTGNILVATNQNIGAGASLTVTALRTVQAEAHWFTESAVATWTSRVESINASGVATIIDEIRKTAAGDDGRQIFLPACPVRLIITNSSGGVGSFRGAIVARPLEPGR